MTPNFMEAGWTSLKRLLPGFSNVIWDQWCDKLVIDKLVDQDTAEQLKTITRIDFPWGGILSMLTMLQIRMGEVKTAMAIVSLDRQYDVMAQTTPHPAPVDALIRAMIIDPGRATENRAQLKKHGFDDLQIDNLILAHYRTVDEGTLRTQFLRGIITESRLYERMRELGYTDQRTGEIVQTWVLLPGPSDLFMMVAKEAFEPDIYTTLGLDQEFPSEQVSYLKQQGISQAWAEKYWIAHWDQPSILQGFEMLHRGVIDNATLDMLFRAIEMPSFWREKLTKIAYSPFTRVDVRRMHNMGVLTDEELIRSYMDIGYDVEKATKMTDFTIRYNYETDMHLTRGAILESYREGMITHFDAKELLTAQDYSDELSEFYLELEDFAGDKKLLNQKIDNIRDQFLLRQITGSIARDQLNRLDLRGEKIDLLMETWTLDEYKYASIPSKSDLDRFLNKGIIDVGTYRTYMVRHGFSNLLIDWFLSDIADPPIIKDRRPSRANIAEWYKKGAIDKNRFILEMSILGYKQEYVEFYFKAL